MFELASNNAQAMDVIKKSAHAVAQLCCNLKATLDLDLICLGGGIGLTEVYIPLVLDYIETMPAAFRIDVVKATGDYDACLLGAAAQFS